MSVRLRNVAVAILMAAQEKAARLDRLTGSY
jgi:hypothetical protein